MTIDTLVRGAITAPLLVCSACLLEPPAHDDGGPLRVGVFARDEVPRADGVGQTTIEIRADDAAEAFRTEVRITASSGTLGAGQGSDYDARIPRGGVLVIPLTHGRHPGPVHIEVRADGFATIDSALVLEPSAPDRLDLSLSTATISTFDQAELTIGLGVDGRALPSWGTVVSLAACCAEDDAPADCDGSAPVSVPERARLDEGSDAIRLTVAPLPIEPAEPDGLPEAVHGFIVAAAGDTPPGCTADAEARVGFRVDP